ncbi:MAG: hypothetical protein AAF530_08660 [Pseudomonadota bacterium]
MIYQGTTFDLSVGEDSQVFNDAAVIYELDYVPAVIGLWGPLCHADGSICLPMNAHLVTVVKS